MDDRMKEVYFNEYCPTCKYKNIDISGDPSIQSELDWKKNTDFFHDKDKAAKCHECLNNGSNWNSHKPVNYEKEET